MVYSYARNFVTKLIIYTIAWSTTVNKKSETALNDVRVRNQAV
jgi:hypothetical protein